jgi:hypothetical protein
MGMPKLLSRFDEARLKFRAAPKDEQNRVLLIRGTKNVAPPTYLLYHKPNEYVVQFRDIDIVTYHRDGTVTLNAGEDRSKLMADRLNRFSPFDLQYRNSANLWIVTLNEAINPVGMYNFRYRRGWLFKNGMRAVRSKAHGPAYPYAVEGARTLRDAERHRNAIEGLEYYAQRYVDTLRYSTLESACLECRYQVGSRSLADVMADPDHWPRHIDRNVFPKEVICRAVMAMPPGAERRRLAILVNQSITTAPFMAPHPQYNWQMQAVTTPMTPADTMLLRQAVIDYLRPRITADVGL